MRLLEAGTEGKQAAKYLSTWSTAVCIQAQMTAGKSPCMGGEEKGGSSRMLLKGTVEVMDARRLTASSMAVESTTKPPMALKWIKHNSKGVGEGVSVGPSESQLKHCARHDRNNEQCRAHQ